MQFLGDIATVGRWTYLGVFVGETANGATLLIPTPLPLYTAAMAVVMNPLLVGLIGGVGAALGETVGYAIGLPGKRRLEGVPLYRRLSVFAERRSGLAVFVLASLPFFPDIAGLWAGAVRYSLWRFLICVTAGKVMKLTLFSLAVYAAAS
jgi:membrane protein YqaA with SNARE-associated domain